MNKSQKAKARRAGYYAEKRAICDQLVAELETIPVDEPPLAVADLPKIMPRAATKLDGAFGPHDIRDWLPAYSELPADFKNERSPWCDFVQGRFFSGIKGVADKLRPRPGVDKKLALTHVGVCLRSFEPKHEHKIAGAAYLMSLWFEAVP